jgi:hemerythrin-like domain-containing protein
MLATENLMQEHQLILKYAGLMERYAEFSLKHPDSPVLLEKAAGFIDFIHEFADDFHHAKEEDILFRYLGVPGVLTHCNPVPQMLMEHDKARGYVQNMEQAVQEKSLTALADNAVQYTRLITEHIYKEDNILYPMGEAGLSDEAKTALLKEYAQADERLDSRAVWAKYQALCAELELELDALAD